MLRGPLIPAVCAVLAFAGCGDEGEETSASTPALDPGATEASPEEPPATDDGGESGGETLGDADEAAVAAAVESYVAALNQGRGERVCALIVPGRVDRDELPRSDGGCAASLTASIGHRRRGGAPAWERTKVRGITAVSVGDGRARVTATVTHDFADREYVSVEEDVIYLERAGSEWLIAKPSGTFYRAVGYPEPPLRALAPP